MALILKPVTKRNGDIKRFDVIGTAAATEPVQDSFKDAKAGTYHVHTDDGKVLTAEVGYRTVQDITLA